MEFNECVKTMKISLSIFYLLLISTILKAQSDSSAYITQRNKVNHLLTERSAKFGQYDNSLARRSGIFGLKTKKDLQASNDILTQIVITDNKLFDELKILLDYKDSEKKEIENRAETVEGRIDRFQLTITGLQKKNEKLKAENDKQIERYNKMIICVVVLILGLIFSGYYLYRLKKLRGSDI